jgi:uncharacterized protein (DUF433 family)
MTQERIVIDPAIMGGKPVIRGTRIPVEILLRKLGAGMTVGEIIADHPRLTADDIRAAQAFAADYLPAKTSFTADRALTELRMTAMRPIPNHPRRHSGESRNPSLTAEFASWCRLYVRDGLRQVTGAGGGVSRLGATPPMPRHSRPRLAPAAIT